VRIGGAWVGLGLGDSSDEVQRIKAFMRRKFSYAAGLSDTSLYDDQMRAAVAEMQARYKAAGQIGEHMIDAMVFFGRRTAPHVSYTTAEAVEFLLSTNK